MLPVLGDTSEHEFLLTTFQCLKAAQFSLYFAERKSQS